MQNGGKHPANLPYYPSAVVFRQAFPENRLSSSTVSGSLRSNNPKELLATNPAMPLPRRNCVLPLLENSMKGPKSIRVLCVDDHPLVREGMAAVMEAEEDIICVGEAGDGQAAVAKFRELKPDVVVMDLRMPGMGGFEATIQ